MDNALQQEKYIRMTSAPVGRLVTSMAIPSIISMLVSGIYNLADTFFVGHINTQSVAALGIVFSYMALIQAIAFYFGQGSGNFISRALGGRRTGEASVMASTGFISSFITGCLIAVAGWLLMDGILHFFGSTETILPYAKDYFRFILIGTPFIMCCFTMNNQMRQQGNAMLAMIGIASGAILNIALDPLLIFGFGMGIRGAGLATAISQAVSFVIMLSLCGKNGGIRIRLRNFKPSVHIYKEINAGGLPSLARQGLMSIAAICLNQMASSYGDASVASFSVVSRVAMLAGAAMIGYGQGFQPVCGFNFGAGRYDRVRAAFKHSLFVSTLYCLVLAILGFVFAPGIVRVFRSDDPEVIRMGTDILRYQCLSFPLSGMVVMSNMFLQNIRKTVPAVIMATARQGLFFIPALLLGKLFLGFLGIEIAQTVSDCCSFLLAIPLTVHALKGMGVTNEKNK
ncbi:MAG: MATE family efflux transporter [Bacteroidales bacterium]|nr:MATE family efflux transporter [Bacteroidales bacterium]